MQDAGLKTLTATTRSGAQHKLAGMIGTPIGPGVGDGRREGRDRWDEGRKEATSRPETRASKGSSVEGRGPRTGRGCRES